MTSAADVEAGVEGGDWLVAGERGERERGGRGERDSLLRTESGSEEEMRDREIGGEVRRESESGSEAEREKEGERRRGEEKEKDKEKEEEKEDDMESEEEGERKQGSVSMTSTPTPINLSVSQYLRRYASTLLSLPHTLSPCSHPPCADTHTPVSSEKERERERERGRERERERERETVFCSHFHPQLWNRVRSEDPLGMLVSERKSERKKERSKGRRCVCMRGEERWLFTEWG